MGTTDATSQAVIAGRKEPERNGLTLQIDRFCFGGSIWRRD